ncbi:MAG: hypothetical protein HY517_02800 [Candidatus Aenigmarchaeota archaeon]|nr:hypothetical protein [Candidatus Aenigmarchaeota archaeon]
MTIYGRGSEVETGPNRKPLFILGVALVAGLGLGAAYYACGKSETGTSQSSIQKYERQINPAGEKRP